MRILTLVLSLAVLTTSCASYRVVPLVRGIDREGEVHQFYAVAHNNVIVPEYVINERGEYPTSKEEARARFQARQNLIPAMKEKYRIPGDFSSASKRTLLSSGFLIVFPISYPIYLFTSPKGSRSPGAYFDLMANGPTANAPELRDEFANF